MWRGSRGTAGDTVATAAAVAPEEGESAGASCDETVPVTTGGDGTCGGDTAVHAAGGSAACDGDGVASLATARGASAVACSGAGGAAATSCRHAHVADSWRT